MKKSVILFFITCICCFILSGCGSSPELTISGELKTWHKVTLTFSGPESSEIDSLNPFLDYRLQVVFQQGARRFTVPGFYAADGNAANNGSSVGNKWQVRFVPDTSGTWHFTATFRRGKDIAISDRDNDGEFAAFGKISGNFEVQPSDKSGRDFRATGRLQYSNTHYLQFAASKEYFLKGGANSPENFLAYYEFDKTPETHKYQPHAQDWHTGDPTWQNGKGKNIIGALNYLASKGMNAVYMIPMNIDGDGKDVWPWTNPKERYRFDCSKLDQWETVFSHMDSLGLMLHFILTEAENSNLFELEELNKRSEGFAKSRKLYYREMIARFGHHLAVTWNLGEENNQRAVNHAANFDASYPNTTMQRKAFAEYIRKLDPYNHIITVHNDPWGIFKPLYGDPNFEAASLQVHDPAMVHEKTVEHRRGSAASGKKWVVTLDENGHYTTGARPDADNPGHDDMRKNVIWGNLMGGGAGVEWYFGYKYDHADLNCEDWRSRDKLWDQTRHALTFFQEHIPFTEMEPMDELLADSTIYCFGKKNEVYAVYLPNGGNSRIKLSAAKGFSVKWYNPRTGGELKEGILKTAYGPGVVSLGLPPLEKTKDWVVLLERLQN